jgi:TetR/AcrR family transcriptional repressor of nem operon
MGRTSTAKDRLIAAMASLAHRRGYLAVGVDDVCREAGVKKGSFYHFFASKRDLMLAALNQQWQMGHDHMIRVAFGADRPPLERIERLLEMMAGFETSNKSRDGHVLGCPFGNLAAEVGPSEPALTKRADEAFCGFAAYIREALDEAKRLGHVERHVDVRTAADAIVAYFEGVALLAKTRNDPSLIRKLGPRAVFLATQPVPSARRRGAAARKKVDRCDSSNLLARGVEPVQEKREAVLRVLPGFHDQEALSVRRDVILGDTTDLTVRRTEQALRSAKRRL